MLSLAIMNSDFAKDWDIKFPKQNMLALLQFGCTPIFYKAQFTNDYLEAAKVLFDKNKDNSEKPPPIIVYEYLCVE